MYTREMVKQMDINIANKVITIISYSDDIILFTKHMNIFYH